MGRLSRREWRALLEERFGPLRDLEREGRPVTARREIARRRRGLAELREAA